MTKKCTYYKSFSKTGKNGWPYKLELYCVVEKKSKQKLLANKYMVAGFSHDIEGKTVNSAAIVWLVQLDTNDVIKAPLCDVIVPTTKSSMKGRVVIFSFELSLFLLSYLFI